MYVSKERKILSVRRQRRRKCEARKGQDAPPHL